MQVITTYNILASEYVVSDPKPRKSKKNASALDLLSPSISSSSSVLPSMSSFSGSTSSSSVQEPLAAPSKVQMNDTIIAVLLSVGLLD